MLQFKQAELMKISASFARVVVEPGQEEEGLSPNPDRKLAHASSEDKSKVSSDDQSNDKSNETSADSPYKDNSTERSAEKSSDDSSDDLSKEIKASSDDHSVKLSSKDSS